MALVALTLGMLGGAAHAAPILLVEAESGKVLEQQEAGKTWYPASVTKLMTVYVALNAVKEGRLTPDTLLTVSPLAASQSPTKMGFGVGTKVTLDNALKMLMVKSANDMAVVIAEGVGGSHADFIQEMNATAARLGMTGTHYENPNGLPDVGQVTTARDLAILARHLIYDFPEHEMLFRIPAIRLGKIVLRNYNRLIDRYPGADGMKTGFICASGFNLVATATRNGKRLIAVILGAPSAVARTEQAALLFEKGFQPSWSIFGASSPTLEAIANTGGPATDVNVCNRKRPVAAAENEDENLYNQGESAAASYAVSAAVAAGFSKGEGAALLQNLPPSMPPIRVFVGPAGAAPAQQDDALQAAKPAPPAPAAKTAGDKKNKQKTAVITPNDPDAPKPAAKPDAKPAAAAKPPANAKPPAKPTAAKPATGDKAASAAAAPAAKPKAADADQGGEPLTFGPPPSTRPGT